MVQDPASLPMVLNEFEMDNSFLGKIIEVCMVTEDAPRTMEGLVRLGIGPFRVYTFTADTVTEQTYRGERSPSA